MASEHSHHILPTKVYWITFAILMVLLILTLIAASFNLGSLNLPIAIVIAVAKATLVVFYFMGVRFNTRLTWLWAAIGFIWLLLLFGISLDYLSRGWIPVGGWETIH